MLSSLGFAFAFFDGVLVSHRNDFPTASGSELDPGIVLNTIFCIVFIFFISFT